MNPRRSAGRDVRSPEGLRHRRRFMAERFSAAILAIVVPATAIMTRAFVPSLAAQAPTPTERVTFQEAIKLAIERNPSSAIAAAGILRAEGLLTEARAANRLQVNGGITTTTLNRGVEFGGQTVAPQNSVVANLDVRMPLLAAAQWARRAQAEDTRHVADLSETDAHRQIAFATADAFISIIASRRAVEASERARDVARSHFDRARELPQVGQGCRVCA